MDYRAVVFQVQLFISIFFFQALIPTLAVADSCKEAAGRLVSIQGEAQILRSGLTAWGPLQPDEAFCPGDMLRVNAGGRVAVVLANESVLRVDQNSTLIFQESTVKKFSLIKLLNGVLHIFSHRPRSLNIATPYVNGAVEGTEFLVQSGTANTVITVFEGLVTAANAQGKLAVASGQAIVADKGAAPRYMTVVKPRDAVQWTLYYPAIIDMPAGEERQPESDLIRQASTGLAVGRVQEAREIVARVLDAEPSNSEALALQATIEVVQNNKEQALAMATKAAALNPRSAAAALALSYAQQAHFDIAGSLATLEKAEVANPGNAELKARLAELQLSVGELDEAQITAEEAVRLNPNIGRSQAVLGFAFLTRIETEEAQAAFRKAIALDPALPLARLGLGLALIREGKLEEGRAEIEIAAALDPGNALIRSYLGKAYYEEKRDSLSSRQYETAKTLDPADPTPWFYDALRKQSINRPVEALRDMQKSIELNDNRAVYRSRLLLDEDLAVRSVGLSSIYRELGFEKLALVDGTKSINIDPSNFSAHRFLSDIYSSQSRHEIARVSELLQSQLLQPISISPVQPQLAQSNLNIFRGTGLSAPAFNEFTPLFNRNQISLTASGVGGGTETWGDEVVVSGLQDRLSASIGGLHYTTDGFRENNDQKQDIYNLFSQLSLSPKTSIMAEYRNFDRTYGDLPLRFDPDLFFPLDRTDEITESFRLGYHHTFSPQSDLIGTIIYADYDYQFMTDLDAYNYDYADERYMIELQHILNSHRLSLQYGFSHFKADSTSIETMVSPVSSIFSESSEIKENTKAYGYLNFDSPFNVTWTVGASVETFQGIIDKDLVNPKFGITWNPLASTTFRAAALHVLRSHLVNDQTLEPTQVSGFNQFYDDSEGAEAWRFGIAVDQKLSNKLFGGVEFSRRDLNVAYDYNFVASETDWQEEQIRLYLFWTPVDWLSTTLEYVWEQYERNLENTGVELIHQMKTNKFPVGVNLFLPLGLTATLNATYVDQAVSFDPRARSFITKEGEEHFWIVDASLRYRLPKRYGVVSLEAKNLFDERFLFQTMDPKNPEYVPEQLILGKLTVSF